MKLIDLLKENIGDKIKIKVKLTQKQKDFLEDADLNHKEFESKELPIIINLLKKHNFKYKGKTPGSYSSHYWSYEGKKYNPGIYRLTGDWDLFWDNRSFIELEEFTIGNRFI